MPPINYISVNISKENCVLGFIKQLLRIILMDSWPVFRQTGQTLVAHLDDSLTGGERKPHQAGVVD